MTIQVHHRACRQTDRQTDRQIKLGGFGLISVEEISQACYLAGWAHSISTLLDRFPYRHHLVSNLLSPGMSDSWICSNIHKAVDHFSSKHTSLQEDGQLQIKNIEKLQHKLCSEIHSRKAKSFLESIPTVKDAARLRSVQGKGAGAWLNAIPSKEPLTLKSSEFRLGVSLRLGNPATLP